MGDEYFISTRNFPTTFADQSITFNESGNISREVAGGSLLVSEQYWGAGADLTSFQFIFTAPPVNTTESFAFMISDLDYQDAIERELVTASIDIDFGSGQVKTDITNLVTSSFSDGLSFGFDSEFAGITWDSLLNGIVPTQYETIVNVTLKKASVPEPSMFVLFLSSMIAFGVAKSRKFSKPVKTNDNLV